MRKLLAPAIKRGQIKVRADVQGRFTHRVRQPDFFYRNRQGNEVVIEMIKLTQQRRYNISQTADAKAFELFDLKQRPGVQTIAVVEQPETPTEDFLDAVQSIRVVAHEIIDPREGMTALARRVERDLVTV
ncbi:MAG: hypothetical protein AB7R89_09205 [Dehalococcoidia bacterium]